MLLRRTTRFLQISVISALVSFAVLLLIPLCDMAGDGKAPGFAIAIASVFWGGQLISQICFWIANSYRKQIRKRITGKALHAGRLPGVAAFCRNTEALVCDAVLGASFLGIVIMAVAGIQSAWMVIIDLIVLMTSFYLHCILNGKTYGYIKAINKKIKGAEKNENTENVSH